MKKFVKICAITGLILFVMGCGITAGAAAMGADWQGVYRAMRDTDHYMRDTDRSWMEDMPEFPDSSGSFTELSYSGVEELDIEMNAGLVCVETGGEEAAVTVIYEDGSDFCKTYMEGHTLKVESRNSSSGNHWEPEIFASRRIRILVPENFRFRKVEAEVNAGEIQMGAVAADVMEIEVKAGNAEISQSAVAKLKIDCKAGNVAYQGSLSGDADLECKSGSVKLRLGGTKTDYNYRLESAMGKITIGQESFSGAFNHETVDHGADYNMDIENGMGEIQISFKE